MSSFSNELVGQSIHSEEDLINSNLSSSIDNKLAASESHEDCETNDCQSTQHCSNHCHGLHNILLRMENLKISVPNISTVLLNSSYIDNYISPYLIKAKRPPILV